MMSRLYASLFSAFFKSSFFSLIQNFINVLETSAHFAVIAKIGNAAAIFTDHFAAELMHYAAGLMHYASMRIAVAAA